MSTVSVRYIVNDVGFVKDSELKPMERITRWATQPSPSTLPNLLVQTRKEVVSHRDILHPSLVQLHVEP